MIARFEAVCEHQLLVQATAEAHEVRNDSALEQIRPRALHALFVYYNLCPKNAVATVLNCCCKKKTIGDSTNADAAMPVSEWSKSASLRIWLRVKGVPLKCMHRPHRSCHLRCAGVETRQTGSQPVLVPVVLARPSHPTLQIKLEITPRHWLSTSASKTADCVQ